MRLSICEFTTLTATFEEDLAAYRAAGVRGIGVCEFKLGDGSAERLRESGLRATHCIPAVPSILPLPLMEGPSEPEARVDALCASVRRLAELEPACVVFLTGPGEADEIVREGIRAIAAAGQAAGVRVALEPVDPSQADVFSFVHTIPDALELIGDEPVAIMLDVWHVSDPDAIEPYVDRIAGVHVSDKREPTRSHFDRVLPGDGVLDLASVFRTLEAGGYDGWYDVEIFSDNGAFGDAFPDSLWDVDAGELAQRARESVERVWERALSRRYDAVAIGSGINSLVAGALLAKAGWSVCVLERNDWLGGAIRTAEITEPGFVHEVFASWHPLFTGSAAYAQLEGDLTARGLEYLNTDLPTATLFPDGESVFLTTSHEQNVAALGPAWERTVGEFMPNAELAFGVLSTELWSRDGAQLAWKALRRLGPPRPRRVHGERPRQLPRLGRRDVRRRARARAVRAVGAAHGARARRGVVRLHGAGDRRRDRARRDAGSARRRRQARRGAAGIVRDSGGTCETGRDVERIVVSDGRATGVRTADGEQIDATRAVLANVTPQQLYGELLGAERQSRRRRGASASAAARCRSTSRCPSRPTGAATSGSAARRSST